MGSSDPILAALTHRAHLDNLRTAVELRPVRPDTSDRGRARAGAPDGPVRGGFHDRHGHSVTTSLRPSLPRSRSSRRGCASGTVAA